MCDLISESSSDDTDLDNTNFDLDSTKGELTGSDLDITLDRSMTKKRSSKVQRYALKCRCGYHKPEST